MLPVLEEMLHVVVVSKEFENQGFSGVLKDQPELESNPGFVPVVSEFAQSNPAVQMRLPKAPLRLRDGLSHHLALCGRQGAVGLEQSGMDADGVQAKVLGSNLPLKVA